MSKEKTPPSRSVRVAKLISERGLASRRGAEAMIEEGRVTVNGTKLDSPALVVNPAFDTVTVDGKELPPRPDTVYYLLYKPKGYIVTRDDPQGRKSIFDLFELDERVESVGRLDFDSEGALLLTNDGDLAHALTHPSREVPKRYMVKVYRTPDRRDLKAIEDGVFLDDGRTKSAKARVVDSTDADNAWVEITVTEGRNRLIRRLFAQLGHPVSKLRRETFATITIRGMERGQLRKLSKDEVARLHDLAAGRKPARAGRRKKGKGFAKAKPKKNARPKKNKTRRSNHDKRS